MPDLVPLRPFDPAHWREHYASVRHSIEAAEHRASKRRAPSLEQAVPAAPSNPEPPPEQKLEFAPPLRGVDYRVQFGPWPRRTVYLPDIIRETAEYYGVRPIDIRSERRTANVVRPRQVAMYLAKTLTLRSLPGIGQLIGGRDHTTVLHGVRKIADLLEQGDPDATKAVNDITSSLLNRDEGHQP